MEDVEKQQKIHVFPVIAKMRREAGLREAGGMWYGANREGGLRHGTEQR
jgi:hypothetical protein